MLYTHENDSDLLEQVGVLIGHYKKVFQFVWYKLHDYEYYRA